MALSQIQCLDDNHVNPRTHESKPEFLYCEEQRLALETLLRDGREAFFKHLDARGLRGFLSELELQALAVAEEPYDPGSDLYREDCEDDETPLSQKYWPDLSDMSTPQLDLGWPDSEAYRGVTRTAVHTQPPLEGQAHIKEVIRKMIAQAQKVIAVVMDVFTDVDIFRDLLDASFKRKVSVYILLERTTVPHFQSMCQRASMHAGHLKNLRVRCSEGTDFYTHSCTKVRGRMGHRFMFVDGDKAVSGSYSYTWMSSRLDRNLITVVTGQAVDTFDRLFRFLYMTSKLVDLRRVATGPEPEPEPLPQPVTVAPPSAALARKLYNPKYALVAAGNPNLSPSSSPGNNSPKESQNAVDSKNKDINKMKQRKASRDAVQEAPPLHPGLINLEKAYLIDYLPIWPEPDPPSDVIGFINIRDTSRPTQVHMQRSEMFETSQAIRFSSPISPQKETLPEVAKPRNLTPAKHEENLTQLQQNKAQKRASESTPITAKSIEVPQSESDKENVKAPNKESNLQSNTPANKNAVHSSPSNSHTPQQPVKTATSLTVAADGPKIESERKTQAETSLSSKSALQDRTQTEQSHNQSSKPFSPSDSNSQTQLKTPELGSSENIPSSSNHISSSVTSTVASANYQVSGAPVNSGLTSAGPILPLTFISTTFPPLTTNSLVTPSSTAPPPVPKPRTVQLVIKDIVDNDRKIPEVSIIRIPESPAKTELTAVHKEPLVATVLPQKEPETVPEVPNKSAGRTILDKSTENAWKDSLEQKQSETSQEIRSKEAAGPHNDKAKAQLVTSNKIITKSNVVFTEAPKEENINIHKVIPIPREDEAVTAAKSKVIQTGDFINFKTTESPPKSSGNAKVHSQTINNAAQGKGYQARANTPQRISYCSSNPEENIDSFKDRSPKFKIRHRDTAEDSTFTVDNQSQQGGILPHTSESVLRTAKIYNHAALLSPKAFRAPRTPEKPTFLHLNDSQTAELRSTTREKESRALFTPALSPTPDRFPLRLPTPDSRTHTPDPRSHTPDFRTPTSDINDSHSSPTSDEYYECSESPFNETVIDRVVFHSHKAIEDNPTSKNITVATTNTSLICENDTGHAATLETSSSSETLDFSASANGSLSSILETLAMSEEQEATDDKSGKEQDQESLKKTEQDLTETRIKMDTERENDLHQAITKVQVDKEDGQPQAPKRKEVSNHAAAAVDLSLTPGVTHNEATDAKRVSARELKPKKVHHRAERLEKMSAGGETTADRPGSVERRDTTPQATKEPEGQKFSVHPTPVI